MNHASSASFPIEFSTHFFGWSLMYLCSPWSKSRHMMQQMSTESPSQHRSSTPSNPISHAFAANCQVIALGCVSQIWCNVLKLLSPVWHSHVQLPPRSLYLATHFGHVFLQSPRRSRTSSKSVIQAMSIGTHGRIIP